MEKDKLKASLQKHTMNMFQKNFYEVLSEKILNDFTTDKSKFGYVYFVRIKGTNKCKIGFAYNLIERVNSFRTTLGNNIQLDGFIYSDNYKNIESELHKDQNEFNLHGEWFSLALTKAKQIIEKYSGVLTYCDIDNNLVIESGVVINSKKLSTAFIKEDLVLDTINKYLIDNNLESIEVSALDIKKHLLNDYDLVPSEIRKQMESKYTPSKAKRYFSIFQNKSIVGRTYTIKII
jgi:hypothetical protein